MKATWSRVRRGGAGAAPVLHPRSANVLHARTDVGKCALDPNDDQPIYIATGKHTFEANGRIFASSDRGGSWKHVDLPFPLGGNHDLARGRDRGRANITD